ncbi:MAG TPA: T9SS type A sorting domain-containing protein [Chitinophagales bacterium]|nr:T9SS type A sorting domain-containing protein [Chitinophagales bacterium]
MKKTIITLSLTLMTAFAFNVSAQCIPQPLPAPGLSPVDDSLDCIIRGQATNTIIYFQNFDTISGITVEWLRIDSLEHLPTGLSYCVNDPDFTYNTAENGCINVTGTTNDTVGQYKLGIWVTVKVSILPNPVSGEAGALSQQFGGPDFSYYVRVKADAGANCDAIDTTGATPNRVGDTKSSIACGVGIDELPGLIGISINPNPVRNNGDITFSLDKPADVHVVIYNSVGQKVYHKAVQGIAGENKVSFDRGNLQSGLYLVGLEQNGKSLVSKQLMLE